MDFSKFVDKFAKVVVFIVVLGICQNWCMYFSELLRGYLKIDTWIVAT